MVLRRPMGRVLRYCAAVVAMICWLGAGKAHAVIDLVLTAGELKVLGSETSAFLVMQANSSSTAINSVSGEPMRLNGGDESTIFVLPATPILTVNLPANSNQVFFSGYGDDAFLTRAQFTFPVSGSIFFDNAQIAGDLIIQGGNQQDTVGFFTNSFVGGNTLIDTGATSITVGDSVSLESLTTWGDMFISMSNLNDFVSGNSFNSTHIGGELNIFTGDGNDEISMNDVDVIWLDVATGNGNDIVELRAFSAAFNCSVLTGAGNDTLIIGRGVVPNGEQSWFYDVLDVNLGTGNDVVNASGLYVGNDATFQGAAGLNTFSFEDSRFQGRCTLGSSGAGSTISIERDTAAPGYSEFRGAFTVNFTAGTNTANIGGTHANTKVEFFGPATFNSGAPRSVLRVFSPGNIFYGGLTLRNWRRI